MQLTRNFTLAEFQQKSNGPLTPEMIRNAGTFAMDLQAVRDWYGKPITVTSFLRVGDPLRHGKGEAVDFVPSNRNLDDMAKLHAWLAANRAAGFGRLLLESDHIHATLPVDRPAGRDTALVLVETGVGADGRKTWREGVAATLAVGGSVALLTLLPLAVVAYLWSKA